MPEHKLPKASENEAAAQFRDAIGAGPDDEVTIVTPQFTRPAGQPGPAAPPATREEWDALLETTDRQALKERGLRCWGGFRLMGTQKWDEAEGDNEATHEVWLFPGEWYSAIPDGLPIVGLMWA